MTSIRRNIIQAMSQILAEAVSTAGGKG